MGRLFATRRARSWRRSTSQGTLRRVSYWITSRTNSSPWPPTSSKTPLTVVIGYAQLLQRKLEAAKIPEAAMAQKVVEQADRLTVLAERLLDVSRIQFGRLALERRSVDLAVLVTQVGDQMQIGNQGHPIRVSVEGPVHSSVDRERLHQVLGNLISNAAKYSPEGTDVEVMLRRHDGEAIISVRDRGRGIPAEQQSMLFQRFYRARTAEGKPGLGLGLYLSKGIVEAHGGKIWFESQEGRRYYLPRPPTGEILGGTRGTLPRYSNGFNRRTPERERSAVLRVTKVRPCTLAVAAKRPSITGTGSGTFIRPHSSATSTVTGRIRSE